MDTNLEVARLFSSGKFDQVADRLSELVEFHIYEDDRHLVGRTHVLEFCEGISAYFASVETDFVENGSLISQDKVVIYGYGEFKRASQLISTVNSCDVYEFNAMGMIDKIHSYCNSNKVMD